MAKINEEIFKAYDIRGTYPDQLDGKAAFCIGGGFLQFIKQKSDKKTPKIIIGRDARPSSPELFEALASGIKKQGGVVVDIGQSTTPMLYFGVNYLKADGGIMITASHNPAGYNGMKLTRNRANPVAQGTGMEEIKKKALEISKSSLEASKISCREETIRQDYIDSLTKDINFSLDQKIIVDCGNGMAGILVGDILDKMGVEYEPLYFEPDCTFPHHEANPLKDETLEDIREKIKEINSPLGVAFDGDADRVGFLDEKGELIGGDFITGILAKRILQDGGPGRVVYDLRSSKVVPEIVRKQGGEPVETRVGHSFIKALMREKEAVFAGELSSHFYFPFPFEDGSAYFESAILAMLKLLEIISKSGESLSKLVEPLRKYYQSGEINFEVKNKGEVMNKLEENYEEKAQRVSRLDGVKIDFKDWWFNVRPSNTEPYLRLNLEANTEKLMEEKVEEMRGLIEEYGEHDQ